ncbi:MAG: hypothetical protein GF384_02030 [Elusimicrobia bacterium]|nr:hypothetical protein [Elusimicrobiota bacterium]MBD3411766.1 hypothetical protein [Elusimicrobiota bacterium]
MIQRVIIFLLGIISVSGYLWAQKKPLWIEQEIAGDDAPLNQRFSYSGELEESFAAQLLRTYRRMKPDKLTTDIIIRSKHDDVYAGDIHEADYWYQRFVVQGTWTHKTASGGCILLRRPGEPGISFDNTFQYNCKKIWFVYEDRKSDTQVLAGNFRAQYGEGLVFYGSVNEFSRPILVSSYGLRPDRSTNPNAYLQGMGVTQRIGRVTVTGIGSKTFLSGDRTASGGRIDENLYALKEDYGLLETTSQRERYRRFCETLTGGRITTAVIKGCSISVTGYGARYSSVIDPDRTDERYSHVFRGDRNTVGSVDSNFRRGPYRLNAEYAWSKPSGPVADVRTGTAWAVTNQLVQRPWQVFVTAYDYDPWFYNRHGKGPSFGTSVPNNQEGVYYGLIYRTAVHDLFFTYRVASSEWSEWSGSAASTSPKFPAEMKELFADYTITLPHQVDFRCRVWLDTRDRYIDMNMSDGTVFEQIEQERIRSRVHLSWMPLKKLRYQVRYEHRIEKISAIGERCAGDVVFGDIVFKPTASWSVQFRQSIFDSNNTYISQYEPVWYGVYQSYSFAFQQGLRSFVVIRGHCGPYCILWLRYGRTDLISHTVRDDARLQLSVHF